MQRFDVSPWWMELRWVAIPAVPPLVFFCVALLYSWGIRAESGATLLINVKLHLWPLAAAPLLPVLVLVYLLNRSAKGRRLVGLSVTAAALALMWWGH